VEKCDQGNYGIVGLMIWDGRARRVLVLIGLAGGNLSWQV